MTVAVVQQVGTSRDIHPPTGYSTIAATLPAPPTAGNLLVMIVHSSPGLGSNPCDIIPPVGWDIRQTHHCATGVGTPSMLVATKVACPGDSATVGGVSFYDYTAGFANQTQRRASMQLFEISGGYGGSTAILRDGFGDTPGFSTSHGFNSITPTGGAEALILATISNENAYGIVGGPAGGFALIQYDTDNDGASTQMLTFSQHVASASGSYNPGTITYAAGCVTSSVQIWFKAAFDPATCLGPVCEFSGTPVAGVAPLTVAFGDLSTGAPISWDWDHGDGTGSSAQDHDHVYTLPGYYTVSLTVTNADGSGSETKIAYIHVLQGLTQEVYEIIPPGTDIRFVGTLDDAYQRAIRPVRNEPGSGSFTINRHSPNATETILRPGNLVRAIIPRIDGDAIFAWFMEQGNFGLVDSGEEGGEEITIGGRGILSYWERAVWLSEKFTIPWWDVSWGTPPTGARGHVTFAAGTYRRYTIAGGVITDYTNFTTAGFEAYFDTRQTYDWPSENSKRFLVHIMAGETNAGWYVHPHQDGVIETLPSYAVGTTTSVLLSDISPDTPGAVLYHLFLEGTDGARPSQPLALMSVDFDATTDSNGDPWATTDALAGLTAELGETYLDTIAKLLSTGVIDIEMDPNFVTHAYNSQGRDLTGTSFGAGVVRFAKGVNIADELRRERSDNPVATFIEMVGQDNVIGRASLPDAASRVAREIGGTGESADETVLEAMGLAILNARLIQSDAIGFRIAVGDDDTEGLYLPGPDGTDHGDFWLGDVVTLHTGSAEQDFDNADERVYAITIAEDAAANLEVTPELGSVLGEAERRLFANVKGGGTTSFVPRSSTADTVVTADSAHPDLAAHDSLGLATQSELDAHTGDTSDAHDASAISFSPAAGIAATDVQAAIVEDAGDLATHAADTGLHGGGGSLSTASATLTAGDVTLTANTYTDIISVSLAAGTWLIWAQANLFSTSGAQDVSARLYDSTNAANLSNGSMSMAGTSYDETIMLVAKVVLAGTATIKLQGTGSGVGGSKALRATQTNGAGNVATQIQALKVA